MLLELDSLPGLKLAFPTHDLGYPSYSLSMPQPAHLSGMGTVPSKSRCEGLLERVV